MVTNETIFKGFIDGLKNIAKGMISGAINMVSVAVAIACAGIIV